VYAYTRQPDKAVEECAQALALGSNVTFIQLHKPDGTIVTIPQKTP